MKILWTEPGLDDLRAIRDYIAKDSETYAANFIESVPGITSNREPREPREKITSRRDAKVMQPLMNADKR